MTAIWDGRLITRHHAADLSGPWELKMDAPYLRCGQCDGNITMLPRNGTIINVDGIIAAVIRHMCMNHGYSLSGSGYGEDDAAPDIAGISRSNRGAGHPVHRPGH